MSMLSPLIRKMITYPNQDEQSVPKPALRRHRVPPQGEERGRSSLDRLFRPQHNLSTIGESIPHVVIAIHRQSIIGTVLSIASAAMLTVDGFRDQVSIGGNEVANQSKFRIAIPDISLAINADP